MKVVVEGVEFDYSSPLTDTIYELTGENEVKLNVGLELMKNINNIDWLCKDPQKNIDGLNYLQDDHRIKLVLGELTTCRIKERKLRCEQFFEKYIDKVNWKRLSFNTNISEQFFEKHIDKVDWYYLSQNTNISGRAQIVRKGEKRS